MVRIVPLVVVVFDQHSLMRVGDGVEDDVVYKPSNVDERRKLFAAAAEKRFGRW